ncbi:MAG: three-Cys-motif partner protein TcmP [Bacillota bacterium]|nr:three-Cys-motif partner protein TcmP [Bacillota bacterium]
MQELAEARTNVHIYHGDCNRVLVEQVFPRIRYDRFWRALCLLDPYGLQLDWEVMYRAGQMQTIDMFLNFPIMHMNRDVLLKNPEEADPSQVKLMNRFWGDDSWREAAYESFPTLFGTVDKKASDGNDRIVEAFRERLKKVAGFGYVPKPLPMRNSKNAVVYYLFFASHKPVARDIVEGIFNKYRHKAGGDIWLQTRR